MQDTNTAKEALQIKTLNSSLLTAQEVAAIQNRMCCKHKWHMNPIGIDFTEMAHGNEELETDLVAIHQCRNYSSAMLALRGMCQKWGFDTSKLTAD